MATTPGTGLKTKRLHFSSIEIWIALAFYYALVIPYFNYVPLWDSMENLEEYLFLPRQHLSFDNLLLMHNGHPSLGYFWPFWIGQWLFPSQMLPVHIINVSIGSLAIVAFGKTAAIAFEGLAGRLEIALLTICFAVQPVFVAYAINMTPDYGVLAYFLATLWLLSSGRIGWAAVTGCLLVFSKEIGLLLYLLLLVFHLGVALPKIRWKSLVPLTLPLVLFGLFCLYQVCSHRPIFSWAARRMGGETFWDTYLPNPFQPNVKVACMGPFVLEFQWIFTAFILAGLIAGIAAKRPAGEKWSTARLWFRGLNFPFRCFLFLLLGCLYIASRAIPSTNQRYFLTLYPLVLLLFLAALIQLNIGRRFRSALLAGGIILLFFCNFRTLDPISKRIAGTLPFGDHQLLSIATIRPDDGGINRDELVYNLEHTNLSYLFDMAFNKIRPTNQTVLVIPSASWWIISRLDAQTYHRTESTRPPFIKPILRPAVNFVKGQHMPETIFVVDLPNLPDKKATALLDPFYQPTRQYLFSRDGYEMRILEMTRKPVPDMTAGVRRADAAGN